MTIVLIAIVLYLAAAGWLVASVQRGGEGWRGMSDRGSATANHYDHVHVSTF